MSIKNLYGTCLNTEDKTIQNVSKVMIMVLSDTLSNLDKLNYSQYSKSQLCSSKIDMTIVYILSFKDKSILNGPSVIQDDQDALGHPQQPREAQPWRVQQVPVMLSKSILVMLSKSILIPLESL